MNKHAVGVLGASGYSGGELLRYLGRHPSLDLVWATAEQNAGRTIGEVFGHLVGYGDLLLAPTELSNAPDLDLAFLALPHGTAAETGRELVDRGVKVVDLSADWRLQDASAYESWYGWTHPAPGALGNWVYGLTELHRDRISSAVAVANPGCYPTAALLALVPVLHSGAVTSDGIVIDATSGVSGAGRKVDAGYLFSELDASYAAYRVGRHQHTPEIEQELSSAAGTDVRVTFTPHIAPMARGLLATCYAPMSSDGGAVRNALEIAYKGEPFVHVLPAGVQPSTKQVSGSNNVLIAVETDDRTNTAIITCAIDNLGKGASGQAVQNANLMLGLDETDGLTGSGVFP
jgi:N-acetyl-gamma-glutamyl-phosphate reductase